MSTHYPNGSVQGLCSAAAIVFAIGVVLLGYQAYGATGPWAGVDLSVAACLLAGSPASAVVPFLATSPWNNAIRWARLAFLTGALLILLAVTLVIATSILAPDTDVDDENWQASSPQKV